MNLSFRKASPEDDCRKLVYSSGPELYDYMFSHGNKSAQDHIGSEFRRGSGLMGHAIHTVAIADGEVVGVGAFYTARQYTRLFLESGLGLLQSYRLWEVPIVLRRALHSGSVVQRPRPGSVYIANLGVRPDMRGRGVGSALIEHEADKARAAGFETMTLDVADTNPRAEALYRRLGFSVIEEKKFRGDAGNDVPNARLMVRPVTSESRT